MSLLDSAREQAGVQERTQPSSDNVKKSHGAEYQRKQKEQRYQDGMLLASILTPDQKAKIGVNEALARLTKKPGTGQAFGGMQEPLIYRLFGDAPKAGQRISALDVFSKTRKGYNEFKQQAKKWADKGVATVKYDEKTNPSQPVWVLESVGNLPPKGVGAAD
jgi:hypothetical protein